jgi:hypothetical protein
MRVKETLRAVYFKSRAGRDCFVVDVHHANHLVAHDFAAASFEACVARDVVRG